jgi:hypothetical protein
MDTNKEEAITSIWEKGIYRLSIYEKLIVKGKPKTL